VVQDLNNTAAVFSKESVRSSLLAWLRPRVRLLLLLRCSVLTGLFPVGREKRHVLRMHMHQRLCGETEL
jgi:hypothetical protein